MTDIIVGICMVVAFLCLCYILTVRLYWSGRFAVYRLVDFVRSRKSDK